ncbi:uncharacterized protein N0V89_010730 [Didymosphaeria variabile]|uniref:Uncharacterized protein n=1 Tax=Didymosphaeria variabile TaxID=1932322 RepID=A0A9W8XCD0_9PLEO|nr:uncharacterized protein N0V89_010730 [Didymosphaeria variabile]KAJ4346798.1 hypothetical protein N0V89_010730 [Didymosphaeria variabile]
MISDLSLTTPPAREITGTVTNPEELERLFWLLYSIEKPHALRPVVMLPALSAIVLYVLMKRGDEGEDCLPYLGIASGFFGKLRVKAEIDADLFAELSELFLSAHPKTLGQHQTPPESMSDSVEGDSFRLQLEHKGICETATGELGCFDFPQDISESIFDISTLDDMMMPT